MRDTTIARRALLPFAAGIAIGLRSAEAGRAKREWRTIALDAGHGGIDPGATSPREVEEKTITLALARELERQLEASGRYRAVLTRRRDTFVPLRERVARARRHRAELLLSIHADALPEPAIRGLSVYTLSKQASDRETALLAVRENKDDFALGL